MAERKWQWVGYDRDGLECRIGLDEWKRHVAKRPEIQNALSLVVKAMTDPEKVERDRQRDMDEPRRRFQILSISGAGPWREHVLRVSVKYVKRNLRNG